MSPQAAILSLLLITFCLPLHAEKIIYGEDGRMEFDDVDMPRLQSLKNNFGAMIKKSRLHARGREQFIDADTVQHEYSLCSDELFAEQYRLSDCSGFLVAPDIVATAGHCVRSDEDCREHVWAFGLDWQKGLKRTLSNADVYGCQQLITTQSDYINKIDFALIRLNRPVTGALGLTLQWPPSSINTNAEMLVIGHPSGMPLKVSIGGKVVDNSKPHYILLAADSFAGNSGAAVLGLPDLKVIGILVRGSSDYKMDRFQGCYVANRCEEVGRGPNCRGESATRISDILPSLQRALAEKP